MAIHEQQRSVSVITPTKNEALNIEEFVHRASAALDSLPITWEIVFADDSDDQTPEIVEKLQRDCHRVRCVHRTAAEREDSISGAVHQALATVHSDVAVIIDADLQHPPEIMPHLIRPLLDGSCDLTIGSRYTGTGSAVGLGSRRRRVASRATAMFIALVFPQFAPCSDLASGLFAFRVQDFRRGRGRSTGFKVLPEALVRCDPERITDVPYAFEPRVGGLSKARFRDGIRLARALIRLRLITPRLKRVLVVPPTNGSR